MKQKFIAMLAIPALMFTLVSGCKSNTAENSVSPEKLSELANNIANIASIRYNGYETTDNELIKSSINEDNAQKLVAKFELTVEDEFINLESEIREIEQDIVASETIGLPIDGSAPNEVAAKGFDFSEYGELDIRIENVNGTRGVWKSRLNFGPNSIANIVIYDRVVPVKADNFENIAYLIGNRNYDFKVESYNYFDNSTMLITLKTRDYTPQTVTDNVDDEDYVGPGTYTEEGVTEYFTLIIKGTVDPDNLKFTPTDEALKLLTQPIDTHTLRS